nr:basic proline-rich protein-like [Aegilops tauschii subsp. strangulata]
MCHHGHRINFAVSLRPPTRDLEDGRRESGLGGIRNIADVRGQPPPPPRSRPDTRTRGLPGTEARPDPKGSGQPLPSRCSSPANEAATARKPPPLHHQPGSNAATHRVAGPPKPRWSPKGPRSGPRGRRRPPPPPRRPAANGRAAAPRTTELAGIPPPNPTAAAELHRRHREAPAPPRASGEGTARRRQRRAGRAQRLRPAAAGREMYREEADGEEAGDRPSPKANVVLISFL